MHPGKADIINRPGKRHGAAGREVVHLIVTECHDISKLLRKLTPADNENLPLLTLSRSDEKSIPAAELKKAQKLEKVKEIFPGGRNFK